MDILWHDVGGWRYRTGVVIGRGNEGHEWFDGWMMRIGDGVHHINASNLPLHDSLDIYSVRIYQCIYQSTK